MKGYGNKAADVLNKRYGERSSVGRAPDCDSGGRGFNPRRPPHLLRLHLIITPIIAFLIP